ncbi:MAG: LytR C-terminal domain-containing protein [Fibrobacterota bacterium]
MKTLYYGAIVLLSGLILFFFLLGRRHKAEAGITPATVPSIGSIQILNGTGKPGAAQVVSGFLRVKGFDVKEIGNAPDWNYEETMVVSRVRDMETARRVAEALQTQNCLKIRSDTRQFDVTVFVGRDYLKRTATP